MYSRSNKSIIHQLIFKLPLQACKLHLWTRLPIRCWYKNWMAFEQGTIQTLCIYVITTDSITEHLCGPLTLLQYNRCLMLINTESIKSHDLPILMPLCQLKVTLRDLMWILSSDSTSATEPISSWECNLSSSDLSRVLTASRTRSIRGDSKETWYTFH
jgi:hypothetical protein